MIMFFDDLKTTGKTRITKDGYLVAYAKVARTGVQEYLGSELGSDKEIVRVMRPESEVFSKDSLSSFVGKPMTNEHPDDPVTAETWKRDAIGSIGEEVIRDGDYIRVPLIMMDAAAIEDYKAGKRELSMGYEADIEFVDHADYDAIQKNIRINHIALVDKGRAGGAKIGDAGGQKTNGQSQKPEVKTMTKKVKFGDVTIEVSEQAAEAIEALTEQLKQAKEEAQASADAKDKELAEKDGEIEKLKGNSMTADKLDAAIAERVAIIADAKKIADLDYSKKSPADIRRAAVAAVIGDDKLKDKSDAYVEARFDVLLDDASKQQEKQTQNVSDFNDAYEKKLTAAWSK
jgi:uncharacterized protein